MFRVRTFVVGLTRRECIETAAIFVICCATRQGVRVVCSIIVCRIKEIEQNKE